MRGTFDWEAELRKHGFSGVVVDEFEKPERQMHVRFLQFDCDDGKATVMEAIASPAETYDIVLAFMPGSDGCWTRMFEILEAAGARKA